MQDNRNGSIKAKLAVYKEAHVPLNGSPGRNNFSRRAPLSEGMQKADKYLCRITFASGQIVNVSANNLPLLGNEVNRVLARYADAQVSEMEFMPPEGVTDRQFLVVSNNLRVVNGRRQSSGRWMIALPLSLDFDEAEQFREKIGSG